MSRSKKMKASVVGMWVFVFAHAAFAANGQRSDGTETRIRQVEPYQVVQKLKGPVLIEASYTKLNNTPLMEDEIKPLLEQYALSWGDASKALFGKGRVWRSTSGFVATLDEGTLVVKAPRSNPAKDQWRKLANRFAESKWAPVRESNSTQSYSYTGVGQTLEAASAKYGQPTGAMKMGDLTVRIYEVEDGKITETYDSEGICIKSILER